MKFEYPIGATPLNLDELEGLIPTHITTQTELNEWESANIQTAELAIFSGRYSEILTITFMQKLHRLMFDKTWRWAGQFRTSLKNIGIVPLEISMQLKNLLDDVIYQINNQTYSVDEIAVRFHHRLVWIHPFANGNGRHARLMTDILLMQHKLPRFSWGHNNLYMQSDTREQYIKALRAADKYNYELLFKFVRS